MPDESFAPQRAQSIPVASAALHRPPDEPSAAAGSLDTRCVTSEGGLTHRNPLRKAWTEIKIFFSWVYSALSPPCSRHAAFDGDALARTIRERLPAALERFGIPPLEEGFRIEIDPNASNAADLAWAHAIGAAVLRFGQGDALKPLVEALHAAGRTPNDPDAAIVQRIDQVVHRQYALWWHASLAVELAGELRSNGGEYGLRLARQRHAALYANLPLKLGLADAEIRRLVWTEICPNAGQATDKPPRMDVPSLLFLCALKHAGDARTRVSILAAMSAESLLPMAADKRVDPADPRREIAAALALRERRTKAEADFLAEARALQDGFQAPQFSGRDVVDRVDALLDIRQVIAKDGLWQPGGPTSYAEAMTAMIANQLQIRLDNGQFDDLMLPDGRTGRAWAEAAIGLLSQ